MDSRSRGPAEPYRYASKGTAGYPQATIVTPQLETNRDLYLAIDALSKQHKECDRSLETYLLAVLNRSIEFTERDSITLAEVYEMISSGFTKPPARFDDAWRDLYDQLPREDDGYAGWHATVVRQIVDLREMDECGTLKNEMRYFGVSAPRNSYWYNFDALGYLECAMAGSFGGWEPGATIQVVTMFPAQWPCSPTMVQSNQPIQRICQIQRSKCLS